MTKIELTDTELVTLTAAMCEWSDLAETAFSQDDFAEMTSYRELPGLPLAGIKELYGRLDALLMAKLAT